jgi:hypothetical protein
MTHPPYWHSNVNNLHNALTRSGSTHSVADILEILQTQDNAFWMATPDSFLLSEIIDYPRKRIVNMSLAGGSLDDMRVFEPVMTTFARRNGCTESQIMGREGWHRVLPGYRRCGLMLRKSLED